MALATPVPGSLARKRAQCLSFGLGQTLFDQEKIMEIKTVIIIMFVVFCLFVLANWLNRPRK